jgi:hypothetical protein
MRQRIVLAVIALAVIALQTAVVVGAQNTPVPRPFPGTAPAAPAGQAPRPADPSAQTPPPPTVPAPAAAAGRSPASPAGQPPSASGLPADVPVYPAADFLDSYDAGRGQRYYLFGTNQPYADIVAFYRNTLRSGGREVMRAPAVQQFDLGKYDEDRMAYPPSVVVKDYTWNGSEGYLFAAGTTAKRYRTVIQIVPPAPAAAR